MPSIHCAIWGHLGQKMTKCGDLSKNSGPTSHCERYKDGCNHDLLTEDNLGQRSDSARNFQITISQRDFAIPAICWPV